MLQIKIFFSSLNSCSSKIFPFCNQEETQEESVGNSDSKEEQKSDSETEADKEKKEEKEGTSEDESKEKEAPKEDREKVRSIIFTLCSLSELSSPLLSNQHLKLARPHLDLSRFTKLFHEVQCYLIKSHELCPTIKCF